MAASGCPSYLSKSEQSLWRKRLQRAYGRPTHKEALEALEQLHRELEERNQSAASSLEEGLEETLTLHRLGVYGVPWCITPDNPKGISRLRF